MLACRLWVVIVLCFAYNFGVCLCYVCDSTLLPAGNVGIAVLVLSLWMLGVVCVFVIVWLGFGS